MRILYLDMDTTRPDHLGCYGYGRSTSPNIDRIAAEGVRFDQYYCSDAPCLPSRTALMSGRFGIHTGVVNHGGTMADVRPDGPDRSFRDRLALDSLPAMLRQAGFHTVSISPFADRHSAWHFYAGFSEMHNTGECGMESAETVTPTALRWIEQHAAQDNWFLQVNYWDPHKPYRVPEEFGNPFADDPGPEWITEEVLQKHHQCTGPHSALEQYMYTDKLPAGGDPWPRQPGRIETLADVKRAFDGYDCGIRYTDTHFGYLLDAFEKQGVLDDLVIIISSDHGENQGELGIYGEHGTADKATCNIPMIVRWPGCKQGHVERGLHYNLDLAPTLAELLGRDVNPRWDGQSFAPALCEGSYCGRDYLVISQCAHIAQRGVRFGPWLYMRTYHEGFRLFPKEMLFNIEEDPHEERDLAKERPDICREAVYRLTDWHDGMMAAMPKEYDTDPLWRVVQEGGPFHTKGVLPGYVKHLEATGREEAAQRLRELYPEEFA